MLESVLVVKVLFVAITLICCYAIRVPVSIDLHIHVSVR